MTATGVSRRRFLGLGAALCAATACSPFRGGGAAVPPGQFDPMVRWAGFEGDVATYPVYGYEATADEQTLTMGSDDVSLQGSSVKLTVRARGAPVKHEGWQRAADHERVNGRETFWLKTWIGVLPFRKVQWEYVDGEWATVDLFKDNAMPPVEAAVAVAATARFGRAERVRLPVRFTEPPPGMHIERVRIAPFLASKPKIELALELRAEYDGRLQISVSTPGPGGVPPRPSTEGYTTVDGHPARRSGDGPGGHIERLAVWGIDGMVVSVALVGEPAVRRRFAPDGPDGILRRLTVVGDPERWF